MQSPRFPPPLGLDFNLFGGRYMKVIAEIGLLRVGCSVAAYSGGLIIFPKATLPNVSMIVLLEGSV